MIAITTNSSISVNPLAWGHRNRKRMTRMKHLKRIRNQAGCDEADLPAMPHLIRPMTTLGRTPFRQGLDTILTQGADEPDFSSAGPLSIFSSARRASSRVCGV